MKKLISSFAIQDKFAYVNKWSGLSALYGNCSKFSRVSEMDFLQTLAEVGAASRRFLRV
ncbi:MAG: hypothetical protein ACLTBF_03110 [Christensenellales bacterium]